MSESQDTQNVVRIHRQNPYTQIDNRIIDDPAFGTNGTDGLRAYYLLTKLLRRSDNWQFYRRNLAKEIHTSLKSLDRATSFLKEQGYLRIEPVTTELTEDGSVKRITYAWHVYEVPVTVEQNEVESVEPQEEGGVKVDQGVASKLTRGASQLWGGGSVKVDKHIKTDYSKTNDIKKESLFQSDPSAPTPDDSKTDEDDSLQELADIYNEHCGTLPKVYKLDRKRKTRLRAVLKEHGPDEAASLIRDATRTVSKNDWWTKNRYNLDNLLSSTHLIKNAELYRDQQRRKKADDLLPF